MSKPAVKTVVRTSPQHGATIAAAGRGPVNYGTGRGTAEVRTGATIANHGTGLPVAWRY